MCEKVKLTQEQANIISSISLDKLGEWFYKDERTNTDMYTALKNFTMEKIAKAKITGYEVEPEFRDGDWVHNNLNGCVFQIKEDQLEVINDDPRNIRHATKQEAWWASHGRGVRELAPGDIVFFPGRIYREVTSSVNDCRRGEYTFDDSFDVYKNELINGSYEVVCFAKDRKDA